MAAEHLKYETKDGVAVIKFDSPGVKVNTLSVPVFQEFKEALSKAQSDPAVSSIVLISGKPECFIAGADIAMLQNCQTAAEMKALSQSGQQVLQAVADSPKPVVAAIMGSCLGGGLEVSVPNAMDMMLTGRNIRPDKAKKMGLVDQLVDELGG
ncbi:hypothetical protein NP493_291g02003 [Ridgeia piscesae]|uniref:Uncharacterized protein n=1 Tax=Ridgeia piscesae TaxID=27915 RepID=A0AAD9NWT5_RIDPI|nr:hypothetical protein NP493_291g02003 [Ridgeia piscesae]